MQETVRLVGVVNGSRRVGLTSNSGRASSCRSLDPNGCVFLFYQGELVFEGDAVFTNNEAVTTDSTNEGRGGAIYNARIGTITFNGPLTATNNNADVRTQAVVAATVGPLLFHPPLCAVILRRISGKGTLTLATCPRNGRGESA